MNRNLLPIHFSPLQGYTDAAYRQAHARVFGGVETYYTPFVRMEHGTLRRKDARDVACQANNGIHVIPQFIATPDTDKAEQMAAHLVQEGYAEIDINLGCPFPMLAKRRITMTQLKDTYPQYYMVKDKIALTPADDLDAILDKVKRHYAGETLTDIDGVKVDFADKWVHVRRSNTEPIIRIYAEARTTAAAGQIVEEVKAVIRE